jgi:hypothetical protein
MHLSCQGLDDDDAATLDGEWLKSEIQSLVFLNTPVGAAPIPMHRTLPECSGPSTLPTISLGETSDSLLVLWAKPSSICSYSNTEISS